MSGEKTTCGPLYLAGEEQWGDSVYAFWAGYVWGLAEKVHLGACWAAMVQPGDYEPNIRLQIIKSACAAYGLDWRALGTKEYWLFRAGDRAGVDDLLTHLELVPENSETWHNLRGMLCGVKDIDPKFHERRSHA